MKILIFLLLLTTALPLLAQEYDLIIANGKVVDGTGNAWFIADVGIKDGTITAIGQLSTNTSKQILDAKGLIVAPGFIDVHAHIEGSEFTVPTADNFLFDGVTSVVTGNCGNSNLDIAAYFTKLDSVKISLNVATFIGHNTVRRKVMGDVNRPATDQELEQMKALVAKAMQDGAVGLSTGLIYVPGTYATTAEVVELAKVAAAYGGVYASHIRDEGDDVREAVEEAINIGRQANIPVQISHYKVTYRPNWGRSVETIALVEQARAENIDVTVDQYPYVASSTTLDTTIPTWVFSGGRDSMHLRISNKVMRLKIKKEMVANLKGRKESNFNYAIVARFPPDTTYNGKSISEINILKRRKPKPMEEAETILEMVDAADRTQMVYFSMNEEDLKRILKFPHTMVASDAGIVRYQNSMPHPRAYGTNARVLGEYVRKQQIIHLEDAIRKMTSLPAQKFKLYDRGLLRVGMAADVVVFDAQQIEDKATFAQPHAYSEGMKWVLVNGEILIEAGQHTGARTGLILKH